MAASMSWRRVLSSVYAPALAGVFTRVRDRLFRAGDRSRGSSVLLLAPLQAESPPVPLAPPSPGPAHAGGVMTRFLWMADYVPAFRVPGDRVRVLRSPEEFYQVLKARIKTAKTRVVLASLYLGTGPLEQDLVDCLQEALERSSDEGGAEGEAKRLQVSILLDYTRGSRGTRNSRSMLLPLLRRFSEQMRVSLYHTPDLRGALRLLVPERFNETIGVQHIKVYLFDNSLVVSGANLSESYFTNRQDRYVLLEDCPALADFFAQLVGAVGAASLQLAPDDSVAMMEGMVHPYKGDRAEFSAVAGRGIMAVLDAARSRQRLEEAEPAVTPPPDTWVFPLVQMKPLGVALDEQVTGRLLQEAGPDARVFLTSGYFNLTRPYTRLLLAGHAPFRILTAAPQVNGFFGARGVAGAIPAAYTHLARQFYRQVCRLGQQRRVQLHEFYREHWTFHAKGLWYYLIGCDKPCLTLIGSPNFGYRSVHRDLEAQIAIVTENPELQAQLHQEQEMLYERSTEVCSATFRQPDRHVKLWVQLVTPLIKNFF